MRRQISAQIKFSRVIDFFPTHSLHDLLGKSVKLRSQFLQSWLRLLFGYSLLKFTREK